MLRLFLNHLKLYWPMIPRLYLFCCNVIWFVKCRIRERDWFVTPDLELFAKNSFSLRSTPQDMAVKFLGQIKLICSQMWRDKTLTKRFSSVIYLKYCMRSCMRDFVFHAQSSWTGRGRGGGGGGGGTWVDVCWVCAAGLSEPPPHSSLFFGQL